MIYISIYSPSILAFWRCNLPDSTQYMRKKNNKKIVSIAIGDRLTTNALGLNSNERRCVSVCAACICTILTVGIVGVTVFRHFSAEGFENGQLFNSYYIQMLLILIPGT